MTFDPTKPVQTRDGRPARILAADAKLLNTSEGIIALVRDLTTGQETTQAYFPDGRYTRDRDSLIDLVNVPERVTKYMNLYEVHAGGFHSSLEEAECTASGMPLGVIAITFENDKIVGVELVQ